MGRAAGALVRAGVTRGALDGALVAWGLPAGPFGRTPETLRALEPGDAGVVRRINAAVLAEGARVVAEDLASPGEEDALAVAGVGLPRASGGPVAMAEVQGLAVLSRDMKLWAAEDPVWAVPPLLAEAALRGRLGAPGPS